MGQYFDNIEAFEGFFVYFFYMHIKTQRTIKSYAEKNRVFGARNVFIKEIEIEVEVWQLPKILREYAVVAFCCTYAHFPFAKPFFNFSEVSINFFTIFFIPFLKMKKVTKSSAYRLE